MKYIDENGKEILSQDVWKYDFVKEDIENQIIYMRTLDNGGLRRLRQAECFSIINRGQPWYNKLTAEQKSELDIWYDNWLNVTETKVIPERPSWLK